MLMCLGLQHDFLKRDKWVEDKHKFWIMNKQKLWILWNYYDQWMGISASTNLLKSVGGKFAF